MKMAQIFIKEGNFAPWLRAVFVLTGAGIVFVSLKYFDSIFLMSIGLIFAALGGYSSRAKTFNLKPFDNSYQKTRKSYDKKEE